MNDLAPGDIIRFREKRTFEIYTLYEDHTTPVDHAHSARQFKIFAWSWVPNVNTRVFTVISTGYIHYHPREYRRISPHNVIEIVYSGGTAMLSSTDTIELPNKPDGFVIVARAKTKVKPR